MIPLGGEWRAHAEHDIGPRGYGVRLVLDLERETLAAQRIDLTMVPVEQGAYVEPFLWLPDGAARALYDALGRALNVHTPDARMAAEVLAREQDRVDKLIDAVIAKPVGYPIPPTSPEAPF